jgi:hypothetical protein
MRLRKPDREHEPTFPRFDVSPVRRVDRAEG